MIRAERVEELVWAEVKQVLAHPALIVAGIESLGEKEEGGLNEEVARAERELETEGHLKSRVPSTVSNGKSHESSSTQLAGLTMLALCVQVQNTCLHITDHQQ